MIKEIAELVRIVEEELPLHWCPTLPKEKGDNRIHTTMDATDLRLIANPSTRRNLAKDQKKDEQVYICSCYALAHLHCIDSDTKLLPT